MQAIRVEINFQISAVDDVEAVFDSVTQQLHDVESVNSDLSDASSFANASQGVFTLALVGIGETVAEASAKAVAGIRTAIHASGGATPGWDQAVGASAGQAVFTFLEQSSVPA